MEIKVAKTPLKSAITAAKKALSKVVIQEERGHLLCVVKDSEMSIFSTNNDLKAYCRISATNIGNEDFSFTIDPKLAEKLLTKIDLEEVKITLNPSDLVLTVFTTENEKSFSSLQSFPADKMLKFDPSESDRKSYTVNKEVLTFALNYIGSFLAAIKDDQKQFDFVVLHKGIGYAANGTNKMGFIVFKALAAIENFKIRKVVLPLMLSFLEVIKTEEVCLTETDKDIGIESSDGMMYFSCLKSNIDTPNIPKEHIKSEGAYTTINKNGLIKVVDRLMVSNTSISNYGIELQLTGSGENSILNINLLSTLKITESFPCVRVNDENGQDTTHVVDYKIFKSILTAFDTDKEVRLHINDEAKFYKVYSSGEIAGEKYVLVGIGSYAKIVKQA